MLYVRFGSFASGSGRPPLEPCPLCPESDSRPPKMRSVAMGHYRTCSSDTFQVRSRAICVPFELQAD
jgi:hypothetical protein